jgi:DNA repair ATPase RecN
MVTRLASIKANAGFLENSTVEFSEGLTCIIGARGTCKSTLIETIRFVFDSDPAQIAVLTGTNLGAARMPQFNLITATLGAGTAKCGVTQRNGADEASLVLERETGDATRIFINDVREHANRDMLHEIEIFSQGDLQRLAEDANHEMRLALIDRPNRAAVAQLKAGRLKWTEVLKEIGPKIRSLRAQKATLRHEINQLETYSTQLDRSRAAAPAATPELETERAAYEYRQRVLVDLKRLEQSRGTLASGLAGSLSPLREILEITDRLEDTASGITEIVGPVQNLRAAIDALAVADLELRSVSLNVTISSIEKLFDEQSEKYYRLRQEQQAVNESLKQQQGLQRQIDHLNRQAQEVGRIEVEEKAFLEKRREARRELVAIEDQLFDLRIAEVDTINALHSETVQLTLSPYTKTPEYIARLSVLLNGSRIRGREEVAQAIGEKLTPGELIDIVESSNAQHLADILRRDLGQMTRVVSHLADEADLYSLEAEVPSAKLEIILYDAGQPKRVEELSKGQKATALLPIILRDLPYPLLFDQPEDDLDNKFIFNTLIKSVRELRHKRQMIFVTHNANIPVLGEADRVIVMQMQSPTRAAKPKVGNVDECKQDILDLLEGGAEAFSAREHHYRTLLSHPQPVQGIPPSDVAKRAK